LCHKEQRWAVKGTRASTMSTCHTQLTARAPGALPRPVVGDRVRVLSEADAGKISMSGSTSWGRTGNGSQSRAYRPVLRLYWWAGNGIDQWPLPCEAMCMVGAPGPLTRKIKSRSRSDIVRRSSVQFVWSRKARGCSSESISFLQSRFSQLVEIVRPRRIIWQDAAAGVRAPRRAVSRL